MRNVTTATIGKGKAIHVYYVHSQQVHCGADALVAGTATPTADDKPATCKRCVPALAASVELAHAEAIDAQQAAEAQAELDTAGATVDSVWTGREVVDSDETVTITKTSASAYGARVSYRVTTGARTGHTAGTLLSIFLKYWAPVAQPQTAEPVIMLWHEASRESYLFEGTDETGDFVWLRDLTYWDRHRVAVTALASGYTAHQPQERPAHTEAPAAEVADLYVARSSGTDRSTFRVLGSELDHGITTVWLESSLTRVRHRILPSTLGYRYEAVCAQGRNHQVEACPGCGTQVEQDTATSAPEAPAVPFTWLHLRVETSDELAALTQALEYRASAPTRGAFTRAASALLKRLAEAPRARQSRTSVNEVADYSVGDEVRVRRGSAVVHGRVTFIGSARNVFHVQPLSGGPEFVAMRGSVLGRI